ncbi:protein involved in cellulose biosynthesis (CelD)-like protein [Parvibaculum lavamentivorans DS-1]|uniref:Protein involved in cellulose biosynthesis (CelD)-like protein n=1 Tax=Parvibaculum lavamentivorans (strain DS-1 / DSM 13023 / NCIMB 13966) TaxID=402881 RepID=A7HVV9_PARL1|nr:GNAT family N-acetyltransferase [Parvibaculum lavamentivorans]ABS64042.1 protein involved in cellulose biosynthesis (CelD)-like protein [Parvibaculum lavamentivorans DS-1]
MEAVLILQETLFLDQLVYAVGALLTRKPPVEAASVLGVDTHRRFEAAKALAPEWRALEARACGAATAFQSCDFHLVWARHFCDEQTELRLVAVRERGRLVLVWPVAVRRTPFGRVASWAGDPVGQYGDVVAEDAPGRAAWIEAAFLEIAQWGDVDFLNLAGVRADSAIAGWAAGRGSVLGPPTEAPALDSSPFDSAADFNGAGWPQAKRNAKRMKKLASLGDVGFEIVGPGPRAVELMGRAFAFKRHWLEARGHYGRAFADARVEACLMELAGDETARSGLALSHLSVGGETAAVEIGFRHGGSHYAYMGTFSPRFAKHSPGFVVTELTIRACIEDGLGEYDPLPPADDYKLAWSNRRVAVRGYGVVLSWKGYAAYVYAACLRPAAKTLYARLPLKARQALRFLRIQ